MRIVKNFAFDYDGTIQAYEEKFKNFKSEFQERGVLITEVTVLQTKFLVHQVLDNVENIGETIVF